MAISEKKKKTNRLWDSKNMTTLGCRMRKDKAETFKAACKSAGTTPNAVYTKATDDFLSEHEQPNSEQEANR